jgi:hypothetical protein
VLCIDGGGYNCLSGILTLTHLLSAVEHGISDLSPRPCEHFDLICGVGSGGLVAILFGCLGMRCDEAMEAYLRLGRLSFREEILDGRVVLSPREPSRLAVRAELERLTEQYCGSKNAIMERDLKSGAACRVSEDRSSYLRLLTPACSDVRWGTLNC